MLAAEKIIFNNLFRCPESGDPLVFENDALASPSGKRWPIIRDIPRFVESDLYVDTFSFEWNTHNRTQIDSFTGSTSSEEILKQKTGLSPEQVNGKLILDAGVGAGRFADVLSRWGANVVGVDLSYAVEAAYQNLHDRQNVIIVQADIGNLPFAPGTFDFIISIGVLHHTPDTKAYFNKLVLLLKPGGEICIWVYPAQGDYLKRAAWIPFTHRIPTEWFYHWCQIFVPFALKHINNSIIQYIYLLFPFSTQRLGVENDILDTFDGYSPKYHGIHNPDEVIRWFKEAGLENIQSFQWDTSVRGQRPRNISTISTDKFIAHVNIENDVKYAIQVAESYMNLLPGKSAYLINKVVLELGPGNNFGPALIFSCYGAKVVVADLYLSGWNQQYHPAFYSLLREHLKNSDPALNIEPLNKIISDNKYLPQVITCLKYSAENLSVVPDESIDIIFSNAVLEHIYDLKSAFGHLARITRKKGLGFHQVDFRDHRNFERPLEYLLLDRDDFYKIFKDTKGECGTQYRYFEIKHFIEESKFIINRFEPSLLAEESYLDDFITRLSAAKKSPYKNCGKHELKVLGGRFYLYKTEK